MSNIKQHHSHASWNRLTFFLLNLPIIFVTACNSSSSNNNNNNRRSPTSAQRVLLLSSMIALIFYIYRTPDISSIQTTTGEVRANTALRTTGSTSRSSPSRTASLLPPPSPIVGAISCDAVFDLVDAGTWSDPNDGIIFARKVVTWPQFYVSVHQQQYDNVRWKSIYRRGAYYETHVHNHFVEILSQPPQSQQQHQPQQQQQVVIDVGMNIGYYSLLSAALGATQVVAFEINPTNVLRMCESLRLNDYNNNNNHAMNNNDTEQPQDRVNIVRRGVSNVDDQELGIHVPSNPGQASMVAVGDDVSRNSIVTKENVIDPSMVTTISLDTFAQEQGWLSSSQDDTAPSPTKDGKHDWTVAILKIDVEGLEPQVLLGATRLLQSGLVQNVLTEFRNLKNNVSQQALQLLLDNGYRLVTRNEGNSVITSLDESKRLLRRLALHPMSDPTRTVVQKFRDLFLQSFVTDLWFALDKNVVNTPHGARG